MTLRRRRPILGWVILAVILMIIIALVAFFAYLGGEQPQKIVEQPVTLPTAPVGLE